LESRFGAEAVEPASHQELRVGEAEGERGGTRSSLTPALSQGERGNTRGLSQDGGGGQAPALSQREREEGTRSRRERKNGADRSPLTPTLSHGERGKTQGIAQDGVDELRCPFSPALSRLTHRLIYRGVGRDAVEVPELVESNLQDLPQAGSET